MKSSVMRHVTVTRILLIVVLGCAAVSVHLALQMTSECTCVNERSQNVVDIYDSRLNSTSFQSVYSTVPYNAKNELSSIRRDYQKNYSRRSVIETTTTAAVDQPGLRSTSVHMLSLFHTQSLPLYNLPAAVDNECLLPLFCSSRVVRNCITNDIIGHIPDGIRSQRMKSPRSRSIETSHMRQQSFKKVFDSRAWGHDWDLQYRGLNASGAY